MHFILHTHGGLSASLEDRSSRHPISLKGIVTYISKVAVINSLVTYVFSHLNTVLFIRSAVGSASE